MNRLSVHFKPNGVVNPVRMTSQFLGLPFYTGGRFSFITAGQISKQNLISAFIRGKRSEA
jgi:hypothetical protein